LALALLLTSGCGSSTSKHAGFRPHFDVGDFAGARIDNAWFPLIPGTTFVYHGTKDKEPARDVVNVTGETKKILGVSCTVVRDRLFLAGKLAESTLDWYAQDKEGNVWYFGEATAELENGKVTSREGSWQAGVDGAAPGVIMQADPKVGDSYQQEFFKGQAEDHAQVLSLAASVQVPAGSYSSVQLTKEWTPLEPGVIDHKYYARGVGVVKEATAKGPRESLILVRKYP
jgi:hypothetical protein